MFSPEEPDIESVSEVDNPTSALQPEEKSEESEIHEESKIEEESSENDPLHRLSISSDVSEIQANLVEDKPYQAPEETKETREENYNEVNESS